MFCCSVCSELFKGVYPETVVSTPCGHLFHLQCITLCLKRVPRCPFCSVHVEKTKLLKLQFTIEHNWKDLILNNKTANNSIISLDNTIEQHLSHKNSLQESIKTPIDECNNEDSWVSVPPNRNDSSIDPNESVIDLNTDVSCLSLDETLVERYPESIPRMNSSLSIIDISSRNIPVLPIFNEDMHSGIQPRTLLTTSLSSGLLNHKMEYFLSILNNIIPNSTVKERLLVSEMNLKRTALNDGYTHILIVALCLGYPAGLSCIDLINNFKIYADISSFACTKDVNISQFKEYPKLVIRCEQILNKFQDVLFYFFDSIFFKKSGENGNEVHLISCENCQVIKFIYDAAGLSFCLMMPSSSNQ